MLGLVQAADQEQAPDLENARMRGIYAVAVRFECHPRCVERLRGPAQIARDECDLGLGHHAPGAGHRLFRTERTRSTSQESLCPNEITELRHRDASQRERWRVVSQGDPLQCAEGITRRQCAPRSGDQRIHRNPVTLVTLTLRYPVLVYPTTTSKERRAMTTHMTGTRKDWLAARSSCSRRKRSSRGAATSWRGGGRTCRGFASTRSIDSRPTRGAPRWQSSSEGARSSSSTTSCSGPTTRRGVQPARRLPTGSTASPSTSATTTSRLRRCRWRRS